jgi:hypothetical protein
MFLDQGDRKMDRARFLSLTLAAVASALFAGAAEARGPRIKRGSSSSSSSSSGSSSSNGGSKSGGAPVVVPGARGGKEDCTTIADPARRHECASKQIGR